jgi:hypothetical protein
MIGEILYVLVSLSWLADEIPLYKIGSTHNLVARKKNAKTWVPKKVNLKVYYKLTNCEPNYCYKLDNLVKICFNHYRLHDGGGTEFYRQFDLKELENFMTEQGITFERFEQLDETTTATREEILKDYEEEYDHETTFGKFLEEHYKTEHEKDVIQRFNDEENENVDNPEDIEYFSGKTEQDMTKYKNGRLFALGSGNLAHKGFIAVYEIFDVKLEEVKVNDDKLISFTPATKEKRSTKQWRIKVKCLIKFTDNLEIIKNYPSIAKYRSTPGLSTIPRVIGNQIIELCLQ